MALSRRSGRSRLTLVLLILTSITVLTLDFRGSGVVTTLRDGAATVFDPVRSGAERLFSPVSNAWNGITDYGDVKDENEALRERIAELEGDLIEAANAQQQFEQIAELEGLPITSQLPNVTARVVSGPLSNFEHTIEINRGSDDGITEGMPVIGGAGLLGRVVSVTSNRADVQLLTDPGFELGIRLVNSGEVGVAEGTGKDEPLRVDTGIDPKAVIEIGEAVITSGLDRSIFPPDVPVGVVTRVRPSENRLGQTLTIELLADMKNLGFVKVLLWEPAS